MNNMIGQTHKKIIVVLIFFNLSACSVVGGLWYERIDQLIANQFLEYANFTNSQEDYVREATLEFKYWNIKNELPKYKKLLSRFRFLDSTTTVMTLMIFTNKASCLATTVGISLFLR